MATQAFPTQATSGKPVALDSETQGFAESQQEKNARSLSGIASSTNEGNKRETRKSVGQETLDILGMETQAMTQVWSQTHIFYFLLFFSIFLASFRVSSWPLFFSHFLLFTLARTSSCHIV